MFAIEGCRLIQPRLVGYLRIHRHRSGVRTGSAAHCRGVLLQPAIGAGREGRHCRVCQCRGHTSHQYRASFSFLTTSHSFDKRDLQTFLSSLEERQKDCRLYIDKIGDILKTNMAHMGVYMVRLRAIILTDTASYCSHSGLLCQSSQRSQGIAVIATSKPGNSRSPAGTLLSCLLNVWSTYRRL